MEILHYAKDRLRSLLDEISRLRVIDFPYDDSENALINIVQVIENHLAYLDKPEFKGSKDEATIKSACTSTLTSISSYLPILGFILRSTNVRNGFELYRPLKRIAQAVLDVDVGLLLSSEWEYSPYVFKTHHPRIEALKNFVLIGLPAHESSNPLISPLAGHELGHLIWAQSQLVGKYQPQLADAIVTLLKERWNDGKRLFEEDGTRDKLDVALLGSPPWSASLLSARMQAEETFCDFVGIRIFGESFLHAFAYLLAPNQDQQRDYYYPNVEKRVANHLRAAKRYKLSPREPAEYVSKFSNLPEWADEKQRFLLSLADDALDAVLDKLIDEARKIIDRAKIPKPSSYKAGQIYRSIRKFMVPSSHTKLLPNIINAGWRANHDENLWPNRPKLNKHLVLTELLLKNIEVLEIEQELGERP